MEEFIPAEFVLIQIADQLWHRFEVVCWYGTSYYLIPTPKDKDVYDGVMAHGDHVTDFENGYLLVDMSITKSSHRGKS